jgi:putative phosphoesterase
MSEHGRADLPPTARHPRRAVVGVVSDTHAPRFWKGMPERVAEALADVDVVLHAGDVCEPSVLDELAAIAPVHVVQGNNDGDDVAAWGAPERLEVELAGVRVAMIHDSGAKDGRARRLRRWFPEADVVVFGHSHIPWDETGVDGQRLLNPGSPTDKRRQPHGTVGRLVLADGRVESWTLVEVR